MMRRAPHLQDERLLDCYYAERRGDTMDPPSADHLADCDACARRYAEVGAFLTTLSADADADADALFPPERLRAQQQDIARRIEMVGRPARVISFPGRFPGPVAAQKARPSLARLTMRWVAVAAAAGVFVGVAAGTVLDFGERFDFARSGRRGGTNMARQVTNSSLPSRLSSAVVATAVDMDDMFMSDLESALDRPHTGELVAFDALTPHLRDVRDLAR